jgi:predicted PolB exonuclease-like 3'-5' exonuclease
MHQKILTFDIETIPDVENAKKILGIESLNEQDAWNIIRTKRLEKTGSDFLPHYLQKIVAISLVFQEHRQIKVWSIGHENETEAEIISRFFSGIEKHQPTLVSWNGGGFDLPVLHYRALLHHVQAPTYWETGEHFSEFKWNNYLGRYHSRHTDIMDVLANYQNRAFAPLDEFSHMTGLPGKIGLHGKEVYPFYQLGKIQEICDYCESDVLNTHLLYLRFLFCKGTFSLQQYHDILESMMIYLSSHPHKTHWQKFYSYLSTMTQELLSRQN